MKIRTPFAIAYMIRQAVAKASAACVQLLYERTILVLTILLCAGVTVTLWYLAGLWSSLIESAALEGTSMHSESLEELRTIYTSEVVERVRSHGIEVSHDYATKEGAIPLPVTFSIELGKRIGERGSGIQVRLYSDYPFPFRTDGGPRDDFEREALRQLRKYPDIPFYRFEDFQGRRSLRYATADRMRPSCVSCHNTHPESPKTDWKVGNVRGVLEIIRPLDSVVAQTRAGLRGVFGLLATMTVLGLFGLALVIGRLRRSSAELEQRVAERSATEARLAALHEINLAATSTLDLPTVLDVLLEKIDLLLPYSAASVRLFDKQTGKIEPVACRNLDKEEWKAEQWRGGRGIPNVVFEGKAPWMVSNIQTHPRVRDPEFYRKHGLVSYLGVPLKVKDDVLGVLSVYTKEAHQFSTEEVEFLSTLARQAAIAIHNSQLYEQTKQQAVELVRANEDLGRREEIQKLLKEISQDITLLGIDSLLKKLTEKIREVFKVDVCDVRVHESKSWRTMGISGIEPERLLSGSTGTARGRSKRIIESRRPLLIPDITQQTDISTGRVLSRLGFRGYLGVPLFSRGGEVIGVLRALTYQPRDFTQEEVDLVQQLANGAATALENARLLEQTKKQAVELEKANKVKDEFLGFVSHELRTPVNAVIGHTGMIQDGMFGVISPEQEKTLKKVMTCSKDLLGMINLLLQATRLEAGVVKVEKDEVNLGSFLDELRSTYDLPLDKGLTLKWDYPCDLPVAKTDSDKLRHILQNLINNAIKYTDKGYVSISARIKEGSRQHAEGNKQPEFVEFKVADTGIGIPKEEVPFIFDMFRQVDGSQGRRSGGVGLGLHIVKKFTELLGGKIDVETELGKGSTFTVTLPCDR